MAGIDIRRGAASTGPRAPRTERRFDSKLQTGAEINISLNVNKSLAKDRENAIRANPTKVIGTDLGYNYERVAVRKGHPLVIERGSIKHTGREGMFPTRASTLSCFAGMYIGAYSSQEDFERSYRFIGISTGDVNFGINSTNEKQVGCHVAGAVSVEWNSNSPIGPGQLAIWMLPNINKAVRDQESTHLPDLKERHKEEFGVWFRALEHDEYSGAVSRAITKRFTSEMYTDFSVLLDDRASKLDVSSRFSMYIGALVMFSGWNFLLHALERGYVTLPADTPVSYATNIGSFRDDYDRYARAENALPVELHGVDAVRGTRLTDEEVRKRAEFAKFLAAKSGLLPSTFKAPGSRLFIDTVIARTLRSAIGNRDAYEAGDISYMFGPSRQISTQGNAATNTILLSTPEGCIAGYQGRIGTDVYRGSVDLLNSINEKVAFMALNSPSPGGNVHALLRLH